MKKVLLGAIVLAAGSFAAWHFLAKPQAQSNTVATTSNTVIASTTGEQKTLRIALEGKYPPFEYINEQNQLVGFNVDLANALCKEMKVRCEFTRFDFDNLIPSLNENKADAIVSSLSITDEREKLVQFTDVYSKVPGAYVAEKKAKLIWPVITAERIKGSSIGVVEKTTFDDYLSNEMDSKKVNIKRFKSADDMMAALNKGEINLVFDDSAVLGQFLGKPQNGERFEMVGNRIDSAKWLGRGEAIALRKEDGELRDQFNIALRKIIANGQHKEMGYKYFTLRIL
ncbi:transporter substrate-binding domain-containing protein [Chitinibacter bivalviorum]|uniref:Transporter substrate-binding domain-containing protein n=1 Tax=Chitinibacter bivalviorum TaxID=2739434 RepID=A0A7H9BKT5_9NEIS|nr:transporter substrate-binding domain-containing protein [Chitinibacter bivalviorum]QLG89183.1 transporter substrate-binding domain-containing protein [Chitinibacter bivalviorum]